MAALNGQKITSIGKVNSEVTLFLRGIGMSDYMIMKIYEEYGDAAIAFVKENPFWILEEYPTLGFKKVDEMAKKLGVLPTEPRRIEAAIIYVMRGYISEGHSFALRKVLTEECASFLELGTEAIDDPLEDLVFQGNIHISKIDGRELVYLYEYYRAECKTSSRLAALERAQIKAHVSIDSNIKAILKRYEAKTDIILSDEQKNAVINSVTNRVSIITGGPGTGKTTIINAVIFILEEIGNRVAVAAPTGRAAKRIMETGGHFAQTLHRLLEYYYDEGYAKMVFGRNREEPLEYDCVIVDEASMVDILLMEALVDAIKEGTRLILVGDKDQLPSVGAGNVFGDLIESEYFFTTELKEIRRQELESLIVYNAHLINRGDSNIKFSEFPEGDFLLYGAEKQADIKELLCEAASKYQSEDVQILSPVKKGILGVGELNVRLQEIFNPASEDKIELKFGSKVFRTGDRVMQTKNDYQLAYRRKRHDTWGGDGTEEGYIREDGRGIFNGEIGAVVGINPEMKTVTVAYDDDRNDRREERFVEYEYTKLDELEHAYAVTVHKSQGSEYPVVIIPMSWFPSKLATRSLIYTAVTRGKKKVIIVGDTKYLWAMVQNDNSAYRLSALSERLKNFYGTAENTCDLSHEVFS